MATSHFERSCSQAKERMSMLARMSDEFAAKVQQGCWTGFHTQPMLFRPARGQLPKLASNTSKSETLTLPSPSKSPSTAQDVISQEPSSKAACAL